MRSALQAIGADTPGLFGQPPVPLVITSQGDYRREICGDERTGRLDVLG